MPTPPRTTPRRRACRTRGARRAPRGRHRRGPATPATTDPAEAHPAAAAPSATPHDDDPVEPAAVPGDPVTSSDEPAGHDETPGAPDGATGAGSAPHPPTAPTGPTTRPPPTPRRPTPRPATPRPAAARPAAARPSRPPAPPPRVRTSLEHDHPRTGTGHRGDGRRRAPRNPTQPEPRGLRGLGRAMRPRASRSQVMVGVLCALLGFALVVQVSQTQEDQLSSLRQSDLVRLLDDVTQRSGELEDQVSSLEATRDELQSGSGRERAARARRAAGRDARHPLRRLPPRAPASRSRSSRAPSRSRRSGCSTCWRSCATPAPRPWRSTASDSSRAATSRTPPTASSSTGR